MDAGHGHGHHMGGHHRWRLRVALVLVGSFFVIELWFGLWSDSLALLSDAGHMAADVVALGAALTATRIATRKDPSGRRTFGSYRAEVFAAGLTVLLMLGAALYVAIEAGRRLGQEVDVQSGAMMIVGGIGLAVNVTALLLLRGGAGESLNIKGAYLEVLADTVGSVGVIVAGVLIVWTGSPWWDTGIAVMIAAFVLIRAVLLAREVLAVLGQHAPAGIDPLAVESELRAVGGVCELHDLHLWTLTSGMHVATAHLVAERGWETDAVLASARSVLSSRFGVDHATLQVETSTMECKQLQW